MNTSCLESCLLALLRFCGGAIAGAIVSMILWQLIHPPGGPNYGDGIGYGFAMMFWMLIGGFVCGVVAVFIKREEVEQTASKPIKIREIAALIDSANETGPWPFTGQDFSETLSLVWLDGVEMTEPFHAEQDIPASFLLVEHIAHVPETYIIGFDSLAALEHEILSDSGFTNSFNSHIFAFAHGILQPFRILYRNEAGVEVVFSKAQQLAVNGFENVYPERRLEWL